jgi:hypothetical protein
MRNLLILTALSTMLFAQQSQPPLSSTLPPTAPAAASQTPASSAVPPAQTPAPAAVPGQAAAMSPTEAYRYAMQPLTNARSAPDDLTDADKWALGIGMARARKQCDLLAARKGADALQGEDRLALGKLCIFGQDYEPGRQALVAYITLPHPKSPELGRLLLASAFVGLDSITSAESQVESLLAAFPYDASIHLAVDMVIDAADASQASDTLDVVPRLEAQQLPHILDALAHGGSLSGNGDSVDAAQLTRDALRCADTLRRNYKPDDADKVLVQVSTLVAQPAIMSSASGPAVQNALLRYQWFGETSPVRVFHGAELPITGPLRARTVLLYDPNPAAHLIVRQLGKGRTMSSMTDDRTLVLVFSLAGPASSKVIRGILAQLGHDHFTPGMKVIAVTSYAANTGDDAPSADALATLRAFRSGRPAGLPVFLVPDSELKPFAIDLWPAAILFDGKGRIMLLDTLSGSAGSVQQTVRNIETYPHNPPF